MNLKIMFQFLIGSLGTICFHDQSSFQSSFNSLQVVQVPANLYVDHQDETARFNSLQVVQVLTVISLPKSSLLVSIPYRQSRYPEHGFSQQADFVKFQFLIGSLGTCYLFSNKQQGTYVSIPYRQSRYIKIRRIKKCIIGVSIPYRQSRYHCVL